MYPRGPPGSSVHGVLQARMLEWVAISFSSLVEKKKNNYMIPSINTEKVFENIQHEFMLKSFKQLGMEGMYINIIKVMYDKPKANLILNSKSFTQ